MAEVVQTKGSPRLLQAILDNPAAGGLLLMLVAALALGMANSPLPPAHFGALAFAASPALQDKLKVGILAGSLLAGLAGWAVLRLAPQSAPAPITA